MLLIQWFCFNSRLWLKLFQNRHQKSTILMIVFWVRFELRIKFENYSLIIFRARVILNDVIVWIINIVHENFFDFFLIFFLLIQSLFQWLFSQKRHERYEFFFLENLKKKSSVFDDFRMISIFLTRIYWLRFLIVSQFMICRNKLFEILFWFLSNLNEIWFWNFLFSSWTFFAVWKFWRIRFSKLFNLFLFCFIEIAIFKWVFSSFYMNWIMICSSKMLSSYNKLIFRDRYWLKIKFSSNRNFNFFAFFNESNSLKRYILNSSFFHIVRFWVISTLTLKKKLLCHFKIAFFKHIKKICRTTFFPSIFVMW